MSRFNKFFVFMKNCKTCNAKDCLCNELELEFTHDILDKMYTLICVLNEVALHLKKGYNESIYQKAICYELTQHNIHHTSEEVLPIKYKEAFVGSERADIICDRNWLDIIIELKATSSDIKDEHLLQVLRYMKNKEYNFGLFVNFNQIIGKELCYKFVILEGDKAYSYCNGKAKIINDNY